MAEYDAKQLDVSVRLDQETIAKELERLHSDLTPADSRQIAGILIKEISAAIRRGDRLGVIRQNGDGSIDINYLTVGPAKKTITRFLSRKRG